MKTYECRFFVRARFKTAISISARSYHEAFKKAHKYAEEAFPHFVVEVACYEKHSKSYKLAYSA